MNNNKKLIHAAKYCTYTAVMILLYVLQTTPGFLSIFSIKPNFVISAAICIAMSEGEYIGGLYGAFAGILCDLGAPTLFGFNAMIVMVACVMTGLMVIYLLRPGVINFVLLASGAMLARGLIDYLLNYAMWSYAHVWMVLVYDILPAVIYSAAVSPIVYYLFTWMRNKFESRILS